MIESLKKNMQQRTWSMKGVVAFILFGAIALTFVFFGLPTNSNLGAATAGRVNNSLISLADLNSEVNRLQQMYAPMFGNMGLGDAQRQFIQTQALESLVNSELVSQSAEKAGLIVSDLEIKTVLVNEVPAFQRDGRFQKDLYKQILEANRLTPADFEGKIRKERMAQKARQAILLAGAPMKFEVEKQSKLAAQQRNIEFVKFSKDQLVNGFEAKLTQADAERVLSEPESAKKVEEFFKVNKSRWATEEQVKAQHILIKSDGTAGSDSSALTKVQDLKKRADKEDFAALAKEFSQDEGSKDQGGDLGYFSKGRMVPEFEKVAFTQKPGQVSDPVKTQFGYHLIKVIEKREASEPVFESSKIQAAKAFLAEEKFNQWQSSLEQNLKEQNREAVNKAISEIQVKWDETGLYSLSADMIPKLSGSAIAASFELQKAGEILGKLIRDGSDRWILKLKEAKEVAPAASSTSQVLASLQQDSAGDIFGAWIEYVKKSAKIERNLDSLNPR